MRIFEDGDHLHGAVMTALAKLWPTGTCVLIGCGVAGSPSALDLTVNAGPVSVAGASVVTAGDTVTLSSATFDRYDLVTVDTSGDIVVTEGTSALVVPEIPADSVPIAICLVEVDQTTLPDDRIQDIRVLSSFLRAQVIESYIFQVDASDDVGFEDAGGYSTSAVSTWTKMVGYSMPKALSSGSIVRVKATAHATNSGSKYRIYVNGVAVGAEHAVAVNGGSISGSDDIEIQRGDNIEIWVYNYAGGATTVTDIEICYTNTFESWGVSTP